VTGVGIRDQLVEILWRPGVQHGTRLVARAESLHNPGPERFVVLQCAPELATAGAREQPATVETVHRSQRIGNVDGIERTQHVGRIFEERHEQRLGQRQRRLGRAHDTPVGFAGPEEGNA